MTIRAADLSVGFHADTRDFEKGAKKVGGMLDEIKMETVANIASDWVMKLGGAVKDFGVNLVMANANAESLRMSLDIAANSAERGGQIFEELTKMAAKTPFELPDLLNAARQLEVLNFKSMDYMEALGNVAAATNTTVQDAASAFTAATMGEFERLKAYGIKATVEGEKVFLSYMTASGQVTKEIQKGNVEAMGSFLNTYWNERYGGAMEKQSTTFNGMLSTLKDNWNLTMQAMGKPIFEFAKKVLAAINNVFDIFNKLREKGVNVFQALWTAIRKTLKGILGKDNPLFTFIKSIKREIVVLTDAFKEGGISGLAEQLLRDTLGGFQKAWPAILSLLETYTPKIIEIVVNLMTFLPRHILEHGPAVLGAFVQILPGIVDWFLHTFVPSFVNAVKTYGLTVYNLMKGVAQGWLGLVSANLGNIVTWLSTEGVPNMVAAAAKFIGGMLQGLVDNLPSIINWFKTDFWTFLGALSFVPLSILAIGGAIIGGLFNGMKKVWDEQVYPWLIDLLVKAVLALPPIYEWLDTLVDHGTQLIKGFIDAALAKWNEFDAWLTDLATTIEDAIPTREEVVTWLVDTGTQLVEGLISGVETKWTELKDWLTLRKDEFVQWFKDAFGIKSPSTVMADVAHELVYGIRDGFSAKWTEFKTNVDTWMKELPTKIKEALGLGTELSALLQIGKDIVAGLWDGIVDRWSQFITDIEAKIDELPWVVKKFLGIESPSKVFAEIGKQIPAGLAQGIDNGWSSAAQRMQDMGDDVLGKAQSIQAELQKQSTAGWDTTLLNGETKDQWLERMMKMGLAEERKYFTSHRNGLWKSDISDIEEMIIADIKGIADQQQMKASLKNFKTELKFGMDFKMLEDGSFVNQYGGGLFEDFSSVGPSNRAFWLQDGSSSTATAPSVAPAPATVSGGGSPTINITFNIDGVVDATATANIVLDRLVNAFDALALGMQ